MKRAAPTLASACLMAIAYASPAMAGGGFDEPERAGGWYGSVFLGGPLPLGNDFEIETIAQGKYTPDWGIGGMLELGYRLNEQWRASVAVSFVRAFDGKSKLDNGFSAKFDGSSDVVSVLFNAYRTLGRFETRFGQMEPFFGAGIGFSHFDIEELGGPFTTDHTDIAFLGVLHAGYELKLQDRLSLVSQASLAYTSETEFQSVIPGISTIRDGQLDIVLHTGLRFDLN